MKEKVNKTEIEKRLQNMQNFYSKTVETIDNLPSTISANTKSHIKDAILGDKELQELMDGINNHRPPRLFLIGRTGVGKSSLINALCGSYVAPVSDTRSCTKDVETYTCRDGNRVLMEICDTRGIAESIDLDNKETAEEALIKQINKFSPDVAILMLNCTHRDDVDSDVEFLKKLASTYETKNKLNLPIVVVINKSDEMAPARFKDPEEYPLNKINKIEDVVQYYREIINKKELNIDAIIAVSSMIDWMKKDGTEIDVSEINEMTKAEIAELEIAFDGRYNIEELLNILENAIQDFEAQMGLRMAARLNEVVYRIAKHLTKIFSAIAAAVAVTPIPVSDIWILIIIQAILVYLIALLSGREISIETAIEFIVSLGGVAGAGFVFRFIAQQSAKLVNGLWPGIGSAISSGIAATGTYALGSAAIKYYIDGSTIEEARKKYNLEKQKRNIRNNES